MRIKSKFRPRKKVAKKKRVVSRKAFSDIIIVGDEEEKADLIDIEEIPGTRGAGEPVLNSKGEFIYDIDFVIDAEDAIESSVTDVVIEVYKNKPPKRKRVRGKSQDDIREAFKRKKRRRNKQETSKASKIKSRRTFPIARAVVALGPEFKKAASLKLALEKLNNRIDKVKATIPKQKVIIKTALPKIDSQMKNIKVLTSPAPIKADISIMKPKTTSGIPTKAVLPSSFLFSKKSALKTVQKSGVSPMSIGAAIHPVMPHFLSLSKDSSVRKKKKKKVHKSVRKLTVKKTKRGKSAIASKSKPKKFQQNKRVTKAQRAFLSSLRKRKDRIEDALGEIEFETRMISYSTSLGVDMRSAGVKENLFLRVTLIHNEKVRGEERYYIINHKEQVDEMLTPDESPDASAGVIGNKPSEIRVTVSQNDEIATSVLLLRRKITDDEEDDESRFREIAQVECHSETGAVTYTDRSVTNVHPNAYEYRAIPVGPTGSEAPEHTASVVVKGIKPIGHAASSHSDPDNNVAISCMNNYDRVRITVESIPDDVVAIRLFKEDLKSDSFLHNSEFRFRPVIPAGQKTGIIEIGKGNTSVTVDDTDVVPDRTYQYKCVLRRLRQPEVEANEEETILYTKPRVRTPIEAEIVNMESAIVSSRVEVSFELKAEFTNPGLELLGEIFEATGVSGNFIEDIRKNRDQLKEVPAFLVSRVDLYTGRSVFLGLFPPGEVKDDIDLQRKVRSGIVPGRKYRYIAKLAIRPPEAFFKNAVTSIDVQNRGVLGLSETDRFEVLSQRFLSGFGASRGLASDSELKRMTDAGLIEQFQMGKTGIEIDEVIKTPRRRLEIKKATARARKRDNLILWQVEGNTFEINFYAIVMNYRGSKGLVGTVPSRRSSFNFYRDKLYNHELGEISYTIYPVYNNMRVGKPVETNVVKREREVSEEILRRMMERKASRDEGNR